jgi:hypothetical protein
LVTNASNDLKFGYLLYLDVFIDFQIFVNFCRKLADFWPKKRHFFADAAKILKQKF